MRHSLCHTIFSFFSSICVCLEHTENDELQDLCDPQQSYQAQQRDETAQSSENHSEVPRDKLDDDTNDSPPTHENVLVDDRKRDERCKDHSNDNDVYTNDSLVPNAQSNETDAVSSYIDASTPVSNDQVNDSNNTTILKIEKSLKEKPFFLHKKTARVSIPEILIWCKDLLRSMAVSALMQTTTDIPLPERLFGGEHPNTLVQNYEYLPFSEDELKYALVILETYLENWPDTEPITLCFGLGEISFELFFWHDQAHACFALHLNFNEGQNAAFWTCVVEGFTFPYVNKSFCDVEFEFK